ncbi:hypothetical protein MTR67_036609 [Solanum verrucosum]|uniref:Uncharacterized protein n=1 Tax=Solanum verrucosum TaxID=315347 RepID=A0AAF0UCB8_SOLVR|nr:hypothetical protein MTR67_036609 [Solanum verrucosum]
MLLSFSSLSAHFNSLSGALLNISACFRRAAQLLVHRLTFYPPSYNLSLNLCLRFRFLSNDLHRYFFML